ncbi:hypothetical protein RJ640_030085 [Escallonia rubra]|uniref:Uncharacterized protein n=1 Tax=Escallonia rubra TaxID=112253 RepID=A0AA88U293_9ASTE|nr:hypothetical protein RJ640_030085 [Escallonia rubra]
MGVLQLKPLMLLQQLSVLFLSCSSIVLSYEVDGMSWTQSPHHAPSYSPAEAPQHHKGHHKGHHQAPKAHAPTKPPAHSPSHPPVHPPAYPPSHGHPPVHPPSYPLPPRKLVAVQGAVVKLECNNTKYRLVQKSKTDKNGYFFIMAPKSITTYGSHKCKVSLAFSPSATCNQPTNLHYGLKGAILMPSMSLPHPKLPLQVYSVGPFAFEPSSKVPCPR